jgi:cation-transporting ATPase I
VGVLSAAVLSSRRVLRAAVEAPRRVLDVVDREQVDGRRANRRHQCAMIEVQGLDRVGAGVLGRAVVAEVQRLPGVEWAGVNHMLGRVVVALEQDGPGLAELITVVDQVERAHGPDGNRETAAPVPLPQVDRASVERAVLAVAATGAGLALSGAGALVGRTPLPAELAAMVTAVDSHPRLRRALESVVGRPGADLGLAGLSALAQGLSGGRLGLVVDGAHRIGVAAEARATQAVWRAREAELPADPATAAPVVVERPCPLPAGPVEIYADRSGLAGAAAWALALPLTGNPRRAVNLALAATPKAARMGREAFAVGLGRLLARRGAVVLDPMVLRRLDRVDTVVLDAEVLATGRLVLGEIVARPGSDTTEVAGQLHRLFQPSCPTSAQRSGKWELARLGEGDAPDLPEGWGSHGRRKGSGRRHSGALHVLGLSRCGEVVAVAGVIPEASDSVEALAAAARRSGTRLVVAGAPPVVAGGLPDGVLPDAVLPGGRHLLGTVRRLQADGGVVLLVSRRSTALGNADVGVGVDAVDGHPPRAAQVLIGRNLDLAALLIEACGPAAVVSRHGVRLAMAGSVLGGVGVLSNRGWGRGSRPGQAAMLAVNAAAAAAFAEGTWAARQIGERPLAPPVPRISWHTMPIDAVLDQLDTAPDGLSSVQTRDRYRSHGPALPNPSLLRAVVAELNNPLTPILACGAAVSAAVGSVTDAGLVAGVTALSAMIGGVQRLRTEHAVAELTAGSAVRARVLRDGRPIIVPAEDTVVGDVVELRSGEVVPADCRVLDVAGLQVDEAALTGEPFPVPKQPEPVIADELVERTCMLYEGTSVAGGRGRAAVVAVGDCTEAGRSMAATRGAAPSSGVEARLDAITATTLPIALGSAGAVVAAGLLHGRPLSDSLGTGVSLAVASVPEGLPFLVNAAQLASARRLSRHGALVRNPRTIEALGRVDTLCFDKTGTLTQARIALAAIDDTTTFAATTPADEPAAPHAHVLAAGLRATPDRRGTQPLAQPTDRAVAEGARAARITREHDLPGWRRLSMLPFEPSRGLHATLATTSPADDAAHTNSPEVLLSVKGAPESVLPRCTHVRQRDSRVGMDARHRRRIQQRASHLAAQGYRVLAVAERTGYPGRRLTDPDVTDLTMLGFLALSDPVRPAAGASVSALRAAGVQIIMITGDHPGTAETIARRLDVVDGGQVITGPELDDLDDAALDAVLPHITVVARGTPAHKVRVVRAFQRLGRTVAMTGDGANDAAAIRLADVGIALGHRATPAARAAADLVVTDDRLETILAALVEGRGMWASVRQALGILVGGNLGEIAFTVLGASLTGQSPLNTRQLLLVNLLTDLAPALAIALRPPGPNAAALLTEGPEASLGVALTREITRRAIITSAAATAAWAAARVTGRARRASTVALAALVGSQLGQTLVIGGPSPAVLASSIGSAAALAAIIQTPGVSRFFGCTPLGPLGWTIAAGAATTATAATLFAPFVSGAHDDGGAVGHHAPGSPSTAPPGRTRSPGRPVSRSVAVHQRVGHL